MCITFGGLIVVKSFLDAESRYVECITKFNTDTLCKIKTSRKISDEDFRILAGNLQLLIAQQREILNEISDAVGKDTTNARIGGLLLKAAPVLRQLLRLYCENHPKAVDLVLRNKYFF
ncbi:unnamed protein product [Gongylonema pulchrum]|uniref:DH domain-containing protein n=1 Tax=Gongylonema pulchrum TaxID=637853 RepID=A0A183DEB3_9BILA|nr:unnamed protein product [Gongylonema pulchrum]